MRAPLVLLSAAVSVDGRLAPHSRSKVRLGTERDRARLKRLRAISAAVVVGAGTLRVEDPPYEVLEPALARLRTRAGWPPHLAAVVVTRGGRLPLEARFFQGPGPRFVAAPAPVARSLAARVPPGVEILESGVGGGVNPGVLVRHLARRGFRSLLVEGGGEIFGLFLRAGLVDEIHLTVCPCLVGGTGAPTLFDGEGFARPPFPKLRLVSCRRVGDEVYLRYCRVP